MPIVRKVLENMPDASLGADHGIPGNAQSLRQRIRRLETNAMDVQRQAVWILADPDNRLTPIGLVNADGPSGPYPMGVEKDHDLANHFLCGPRLDDALLAFRANAVEVGQPFGCPLNDGKDLVLKRLDQFLGKVGADAFDHA